MKKLVIANWKAHKDLKEARAWLAVFNREVLPENVETVVCPALPLLKAFEGVPFKLGAQDISAWDDGPHTGEVAALQICDLVEYVIVGHSERRRDQGETDATVIKKAQNALAANLIPIICVSDLTQVEALAKEDLPEDSIVLAYEPLDAVSTNPGGHVYSVAEVLLFVASLRKFFPTSPVLYGGSVDTKNVMEFAAEPALAGALVGADSLKANDFLNIVRVYAVC